jgi:structure-specific recognition protein 1/high mobility group protein B2/high mobility group protein B3
MSSEEDDSDIDDDEEEEVAIVAPAAKKKRRKTKKNKDPNKPKRNMSAFFLYSNAHRVRVKEENADAKFGDIVSRSIG